MDGGLPSTGVRGYILVTGGRGVTYLGRRLMDGTQHSCVRCSYHLKQSHHIQGCFYREDGLVILKRCVIRAMVVGAATILSRATIFKAVL